MSHHILTNSEHARVCCETLCASDRCVYKHTGKPEYSEPQRTNIGIIIFVKRNEKHGK